MRTSASYTLESPCGWYLPSTSPTTVADFLYGRPGTSPSSVILMGLDGAKTPISGPRNITSGRGQPKGNSALPTGCSATHNERHERPLDPPASGPVPGGPGGGRDRRRTRRCAGIHRIHRHAVRPILQLEAHLPVAPRLPAGDQR